MANVAHSATFGAHLAGEGAWDVLGVEDGELGAYGLKALTRRLSVIGVSMA